MAEKFLLKNEKKKKEKINKILKLKGRQAENRYLYYVKS